MFLNNSNVSPKIIARVIESKETRRSSEEVDALLAQTKKLNETNKKRKVNNASLKAFMKNF